MAMAELTEGELEVMRILWEAGKPMKPAEIIERFPRAIKNPALRSYLAVLLEKDHVRRTLQGKAYFYEPKTPRENAFRATIRRITDAFCGGSKETLLFRLLREERWSEQDLIKLRRMAEADAEPGSALRKRRRKS